MVHATEHVAPSHDRMLRALCRYADRMHAAIGVDHHVASPLGAWLVLALTADAARGAEVARIADVLGMPGPEAAAAARRLLDAPHPGVAAAAAAWTAGSAGALPHDAAAWLAALPAAVAQGPIPTQSQADAWAREHTFGLIDAFPINMKPQLAAVLSSALATRISWWQPFERAGAAALRSGWCDRVDGVLRTPSRGHDCAVVAHPDAGDIAVHRAFADGLTVTSVIAAEDVAAQQVLAAAHDVACNVADRRIRKRSLFDLPLGDGPSWTVTESNGNAGAEDVSALLPAWSATTRHNLTRPGFGFAPAAATLMRLFNASNWTAVQAATARFHRLGFEAAAVTALAVAVSFRPPRPDCRAAVLRFDRPFAVVATATNTVAGPSPWHGLPVFSAWVTEPEDVPQLPRLRGSGHDSRTSPGTAQQHVIT